jgi:hypothetical protein
LLITCLFHGKIFCVLFIVLTICLCYIFNSLYSAHAQVGNVKKYFDPGQKLTFLYPDYWSAIGNHDNITGTTEVKLSDPNSTRFSISVLYSPNDPLLLSKTGKSVVPARALKNFENEISLDYIFFNSTGKFPHKYCLRGFVCASDVVDYMKSKGRPGKLLLVLVKLNEKDLLIFSFSDSKRTFYKSLSSASQILGSIKIS